MTHETVETLNNFNQQYKLFFINSQVNYEISLIDKMKESSKAFHSYIRQEKVGTPSIHPLRKTDGSVTTDCTMMSEILAIEFFSVCVDTELALTAPHQFFPGSFSDVPLSLSYVKLFSELKVDSSMGPDDIHPVLLHSCPSLTEPFLSCLSSYYQKVLSLLPGKTLLLCLYS